jgi:hypothetical protein
VKGAAFANVPILMGDNGWKDTVSKRLSASPAEAAGATEITVSPGFFRTLGIPVNGGRDFSWFDDKSHPRVAIIDDILAKRVFGDKCPIGQHIRFGVWPDNQDLEIVGVSRHARLLDVRDADGAFLFLPMAQDGLSDEGATLLVRGATSAGFAQSVEREVKSFGHEYASRTSTVSQRNESAMANEEMTANLSSFFAALGLLVAGFGLFGLLTYSISVRTREMGIRLAMGSQRMGILNLVLKEAFYLTLLGVVFGIPLAIVVSRIFASMLFALSFADPMTLLTASLVLLVTGVGAGLLPALRAMRLEPMAALRHE